MNRRSFFKKGLIAGISFVFGAKVCKSPDPKSGVFISEKPFRLIGVSAVKDDMNKFYCPGGDKMKHPVKATFYSPFHSSADWRLKKQMTIEEMVEYGKEKYGF